MQNKLNLKDNNNIKFLFFDIECSNCFNGVGKMCEFGYVLTDSNFNVIKARDIPMSPGKRKSSRFHLKGRKHEKDLILAYDLEFYNGMPEFPAFYKTIKALVEEENTICFAYSMSNDISHLYYACKRYNLEPLNYICYDVQKLAGSYLETKERISLTNACKRIVGPNGDIKLQTHLSRDDAEEERLVLEAICTLSNKDALSLLEESSFAKANSIEHIKKKDKRYIRRRVKSEGHNIYRSMLAPKEDLVDISNLGRRYNVSGDLKADLPKLENTIKLIRKSGGIFSDSLTNTDYFIVLDQENKEDVLKKLKFPLEAKMLTYEEFVEMKK